MTEKELRQKFVDTAITYIGAVRGSEKHKDIIAIYNSHKPLARGYKMAVSDNWCAAFASAMAIKCGLTDIMPVECSCNRMIEQYKSIGGWTEKDNFVPKVGDLVMYDWDDGANYAATDNENIADHVGIVVSCDGKQFRVIEGNKGVKSVVGYRLMAVNGRYIRGFCRPSFEKIATKETEGKCMVELRALKYGMEGRDVRTVMLRLRDLGYYKDEIAKDDKHFGPKMLAAVNAYRKWNGLAENGLVDAAMWKMLLSK